MSLFKTVVIIYNPHSTRDSKTLASEIAAEFHKTNPDVPIKQLETMHKGHAEELAYDAAREPQVLIVSVGGDGSYNEVINGAMKAQQDFKTQPICMVAPGGNANDHYSTVVGRPVHEVIRGGDIAPLDILQIKGRQQHRYAHSYIGLGLTPQVAVELNRHTLSALKEMKLAFQSFWKFRPFSMVLDDKSQQFDSVICANIPVMAKHLKLATEEQATPDDGKFEVVIWPSRPKVRLLFMLVKSAIWRNTAVRHESTFSFKVLTPTPAQLDGEIMELAGDQEITISILKGALRTMR